MDSLQSLYQGRPNIRYPQPPLPPLVRPDNPTSSILGGLGDLLQQSGASDVLMQLLMVPELQKAVDYLQPGQDDQYR